MPGLVQLFLRLPMTVARPTADSPQLFGARGSDFADALEDLAVDLQDGAGSEAQETAQNKDEEEEDGREVTKEGVDPKPQPLIPWFAAAPPRPLTDHSSAHETSPKLGGGEHAVELPQHSDLMPQGAMLAEGQGLPDLRSATQTWAEGPLSMKDFQRSMSPDARASEVRISVNDMEHRPSKDPESKPGKGTHRLPEPDTDRRRQDLITPQAFAGLDIARAVSHLDPVILPPAQQIIALMTGPHSSERLLASSPEQSQMPSVEIRTLRLKLKPEDLGEVDVTLRRSGSEMKIHISVTRKAAADALQNDLGLLEDRLGGVLLGGSSQPVTITIRSPDAYTPFGSQLDSGSPGNPPSTDGNGQATHGGGRPSSGKEDAPSRFKRQQTDEEDSHLRTIASGLVV